MKRFLAIATAFLLAAAPLGAQTIFQPAEVTISTEVITIDGKNYFSHVVRERQTLYSIGKAYGVSSLDIIDLNPSLNLDTRPIKAGDVLLIPVTEKALAQINRPLEKDIRQIKRVDRAAVVDSTAVTADSLEVAIGSLKVAADSVVVAIDSVEVAVDSVEVAIDSLEVAIDSLEVAIDSLEVAIDSLEVAVDSIAVALLLPMEANDSTANVRYLNYYFGSLLAARDMSAKGVQMKISTIDTSNPVDFARTPSVLHDADVIIGPVSTSDILMTLPYLPEGKFLVSPMDSKTEELTVDSPVILAATPVSTQVKDAVSWMMDEKADADTLILVRESDVRLTAASRQLREIVEKAAINEELSNAIEVDYSIANGLEMNEWFGVHTHLGDTATRVMVLSEREVFVKDVIRNVYLQNSLKHNVTIYGPSRTRSNDVEEMCNAYLHNSVTYYVDYDNPEVIDFVSNYRALFHCEPDSFAFHGYDTMRYFVSICARYGSNWPSKLEHFRQSGLQTHFRFETTETVGKVNAGLRRVLYTPGFVIYVMDK